MYQRSDATIYKTRSNKQVASENVTCFYYWKDGGLKYG